MNKYQKRAAALKENLTVFEVCMTLKGNKDGSGDSISIAEKWRYIDYLKTMIDTWEVEPGTVIQVAFDFAIRNLILATLDLVKE